MDVTSGLDGNETNLDSIKSTSFQNFDGRDVSDVHKSIATVSCSETILMEGLARERESLEERIKVNSPKEAGGEVDNDDEVEANQMSSAMNRITRKHQTLLLKRKTEIEERKSVLEKQIKKRCPAVDPSVVPFEDLSRPTVNIHFLFRKFFILHWRELRLSF